MIAEFFLTILYAQVVVHLSDTARPGLIWTDDHVAQGFAWSEGIASFGVPDHDGQSLVMVTLPEAFSVSEDTLWAVQTPFAVSSAPLQIGTIGDVRAVPVPLSSYNLVFEALPGSAAPGEDAAYVLRLHFVRTTEPEFAIIRQGVELSAGTVVRRDADRP